jgi:hypothetical protein
MSVTYPKRGPARKVCKTCGVEKAADEFYRSRGYLKSSCKPCSNALRTQQQKEQWADPEYRNKVLENNRTYYWDNVEAQRKRLRGRTAKRRFWRSGMTPERYDELKLKQEGKCAICGTVPELLDADHCHTEKKPRGLLCRHCNLAIGLLKDDVRVLQQAIKYLRQYQTSPAD